MQGAKNSGQSGRKTEKEINCYILSGIVNPKSTSGKDCSLFGLTVTKPLRQFSTMHSNHPLVYTPDLSLDYSTFFYLHSIEVKPTRYIL